VPGARDGQEARPHHPKHPDWREEPKTGRRPERFRAARALTDEHGYEEPLFFYWKVTVAVPRPPRAVASIVSVPAWPPLVTVKGAWPEGSVVTTVEGMAAESGPAVTAKVTGTAAAAVPLTVSTLAVTVWAAFTAAVASGGVIVTVAVLVPDAKSCAPCLASLLDLTPKYVPTNPVIPPNSAVKNPSAVDRLLKALAKSSITMNPKKTAMMPKATT